MIASIKSGAWQETSPPDAWRGISKCAITTRIFASPEKSSNAARDILSIQNKW